jgi:BlaI family transcriptional regulator, penicillinase repressor
LTLLVVSTTLVVVGNESLTDLQLAVMKAVWQIQEGTVGDVLAVLSAEGRELAPTTVATLLQRLGRQGWVKYRKNGRQLLYRAKVREADAARGMLKRLLNSFFGGKVSALTAQLLESDELSAEELRELRGLIKGKGR